MTACESNHLQKVHAPTVKCLQTPQASRMVFTICTPALTPHLLQAGRRHAGVATTTSTIIRAYSLPSLQAPCTRGDDLALWLLSVPRLLPCLHRATIWSRFNCEAASPVSTPYTYVQCTLCMCMQGHQL